jgi:hypothetical protein
MARQRAILTPRNCPPIVGRLSHEPRKRRVHAGRLLNHAFEPVPGQPLSCMLGLGWLAKRQGPACVNGVGMPSSFQLKSSGQPGVRTDGQFEGGLALNRAHSPLRVVWTTSSVGWTGSLGSRANHPVRPAEEHANRGADDQGEVGPLRRRLRFRLRVNARRRARQILGGHGPKPSPTPAFLPGVGWVRGIEVVPPSHSGLVGALR